MATVLWCVGCVSVIVATLGTGANATVVELSQEEASWTARKC